MYWIMNSNNKFVLEWGPSVSNNVHLSQRSQVARKNQLWYLEETSGFPDFNMIRNVEHEDKVIDLGPDDQTVRGWNPTGAENQRWKVTDIDSNG